MELIPPELDLFSESPMLSCINDIQTIQFSPLNTVENATNIEFNVPGYADKFKDLQHIYLKLRLKVVKRDGKDTVYKVGDPQGHLINNALHSIFKSAYTSLNGTVVRAVNNNYNLKEFIEYLLSFAEETTTNRLGHQLLVPNSDTTVLKATSNGSKIFELFGRMNLISSGKYLLPGVSLNLRLNLETPAYYFVEEKLKVGETAMTESSLKILDANLYVRHVELRDSTMLSIERNLASNNRAIYEHRMGEITTQALPAGLSSISVPALYSGIKPSFILFGACKNNVFNGTPAESPFNFEPFDMTSFNFTINGSSRPLNPYSIRISDDEMRVSQVFNKVRMIVVVVNGWIVTFPLFIFYLSRCLNHWVCQRTTRVLWLQLQISLKIGFSYAMIWVWSARYQTFPSLQNMLISAFSVLWTHRWLKPLRFFFTCFCRGVLKSAVCEL